MHILHTVLYTSSKCWQGEFVYQSRVFQAGDHFLYSRDLTVWFRGDSIGRIKMLVTSRGWRVNIDGYEENQALRLRGRENNSCKQIGQENIYLFINYGPQSQFRFLIGTHLSLDLSIFALVAYFAIVPFLEYSEAASYINRCIYQ